MHRGGFTPLLYAAREGCVECARELVKGKADINLEDPHGTTPLVLALMNLHFDTAKVLIELGADISRWDYYGQSPLYVAVDMHQVPQGFRADVPSTDKRDEHGPHPDARGSRRQRERATPAASAGALDSARRSRRRRGAC